MRIARLLVGGVGGSVVATLATAAAHRLRRIVVEGDSMRPTLEPGDRLLVWSTARPRPGHVVAVRDPRQPDRVLVKRVVTIDDDGGIVVVGDDPAASTDSRTFGPVPRRHLLGVALLLYAPQDRSRRLGRCPVPSSQWPPTVSKPSSPPPTSRG